MNANSENHCGDGDAKGGERDCRLGGNLQIGAHGAESAIEQNENEQDVGNLFGEFRIAEFDKS